MALEITDSNISDVLKTDNLVILQFSAEWCGPCRMLGPVVDALALENTDVVIGKINVDRNSETTQTYGVGSIPSLIFVRNGSIIHKSVGAISKSALQKKINEFKN